MEVLNSGLEAHSPRALLVNMESVDQQQEYHLGAPWKCRIPDLPELLDQNLHFNEMPGVSAHCSLRSPRIGHSGCSSFITLSVTIIFFCRLLETLVQKEKELQALLHYAIEEKDQEIKHLKLKSQPIGE